MTGNDGDMFEKEIESILDNLIQNATELIELSLRKASKDELTTLQKRQEDLIKKLGVMDQKYAKGFTVEATKKKLKEFQKLNNTFIENINNTQRIIHFDISKETHHKKSKNADLE